MRNSTELIIGSRGSRLALWQAEWVAERLRALHPQLPLRIEIIKTTGDKLKDVSLSIIGGRGVFTKELEEALLDGRIDLAAHSLKDLPTRLPDNLTIAAITEREDPRDALVLREGAQTAAASLKALPPGATVGTSSLRRRAQLIHLRPDLSIKDLRGNVDTRLRKLDAGEYDALILASAGLRRLGLGDRISAYLEPEEMLPAVGQGALALETRADDETTISFVTALDHAATRAACEAERALLRELGGGCQVPIAAHGITTGDRLHLAGLVAGVNGTTVIREQIETSVAAARQAGAELAARLRRRGADALLAEL